MPQVTLVFEDGRTTRFEAKSNDSVYLAALKNRVRILTDCLEGACATCKGICTSGEYYLDEYTDEALTEAEYRRREVLTCQMHVTSDCVIEFPYQSSLALKTRPESRAARVADIAIVATDVARLELEPMETESPVSFIPGQYVHLSVPGTGEARSYSFANPEFRTDRYRFYVKILERGAMSDYLTHRAAPGDEMTVTGPFGRFYLRPSERPVVMVAGGTGLAPMLGMLESLIASGQTSHPVRVLYGANRSSELFALEQLEEFSETDLDLEVELCVVEPEADWSGASGHVTTLLRPQILNSGDCEVYLCGPPPMVDAAEAALVEYGVDRVRAEKFVAS